VSSIDACEPTARADRRANHRRNRRTCTFYASEITATPTLNQRDTIGPTAGTHRVSQLGCSVNHESRTMMSAR
jgi:hypothetical protein